VSAVAEPFYYTVVTTAETLALRDAFVAWLVNGHLADVCAAGARSGEIIVRDDGLVVESRYVFASRAAFADYERDHAPRLRAEGLALFPRGLGYQRSTGIGIPVAR
jgi:hypothetical protein